MSHYWSLRCIPCKTTVGDINYGIDIWPEIVGAWPDVEQVLDVKISSARIDVEVSIVGYNSSEIWMFLREHYEHGLEMVSEYHYSNPEKYPAIALPLAPVQH